MLEGMWDIDSLAKVRGWILYALVCTLAPKGMLRMGFGQRQKPRTLRQARR